MVPGKTVSETAGSSAEEEIQIRSRVHDLGLGRVVEVVGRGGMGVVVRLDGFPGPDSPVAVKLLRHELLENGEAVRRFRNELTVHRRLWSELQAPRLVPCLAVGDTGERGGMFGVLPFYPGGSLDAAATELPLEVALRCLADAAEGLGALHGHGYVHRDFCLKNIFVAVEGGVHRGRLGDLGVAIPLAGNTLVSETAVERELTFTVGHSGFIDPWYAGTEQADLFGVGASLYALLTLRDPPQTANPQGLMLPQSPRCRPGVGPALHRRGQEVLTRLTAQDVRRRFTSASEAAAAIQALATAHLEELQGSSRKRPLLAWLLTALAGVAVATGVALLLRGGANSPDATPAAARPPAATQPASRAGAIAPAASPVADAEEVPNTLAADRETDGERPQDQPLPAPSDVSPLVRTASERVKARRFNDAEVLLRRALEQAPGDPEATSLLALLLSRRAGGSLEAGRILSMALEIRPARGDLRLQLARLSASSGDLDAARRLLDEAPSGSTHRKEMARWRVTLERLRDRRR